MRASTNNKPLSVLTLGAHGPLPFSSSDLCLGGDGCSNRLWSNAGIGRLREWLDNIYDREVHADLEDALRHHDLSRLGRGDDARPAPRCSR